MSSKPKKRKSQGGKKKKKSDKKESASEASANFPDLLPPAPTQAIVEREVSAEEVLQASINFRSSHSSSFGNGFPVAAVSERYLYPSMDQLPAGSFDEEEEKIEVRAEPIPMVGMASSVPVVATAVAEEEKEEVGMESSYGMATSATAVATSAVATAAVATSASVYYDDDPVMRKIMEDARLMDNAKMDSMEDPNEVVAQATFEGEEWTEDAKPAAQVAYASATSGSTSQIVEVTEEDVHPSNMAHGVQAELVGESDYSFQHAVATPMMSTAAVADDDYATEEATVLDSKPAAAPSGWSNESAEATVLDASPQNQTMWTMETSADVLGEIAVTGVDEAEATVVEFAEDYHPSDLDQTGVQAELIGHGESLQDHQAWVESDDHFVVADATNDYAVATATGVASLDTYDVDSSYEMVGGAAQATVVDISEDVYANDNSAQATIVDYSEVPEGNGAQATIVSISEGIHPADLDAPGFQAEYLGSQEASAWAEPEHHIAVADAAGAVAVATAADFTANGEYSTVGAVDISEDNDAQATIVNISEDMHPADLGAPGVQAEFVGSHEASAWAEPEHHIAVADTTGAVAVATATDITTNGEYSAVGTVDISQENGAQATIVNISDDIHPADHEVTDVQAEFVGSQEASAWADSDHQIAVADATGEYSAGEAQAAVVIMDDDVHSAEYGVPGARAELVGREFVRAESLPTAPQAQILPMISPPVRSNPRSVSAPDCQSTNPFCDNPHDSSAMPRDGLAALDEMESVPYQPSPTKTVPPPPIPSRSSTNRTQSQNSVGSRISSLSSGGGTSGVSGVRPGGITRTPSSSSDHSASHGGEILSPAQRATQQVLSNVARSRTNVARHTNNVMERLFGSESSRRSPDFDLANAAGSILPRTLLPWSVFPSETTGMWVATVNTNQKALDSNNVEEASKALRAFSVPTKQQAEALARAWAPPRMLPFPDNPKCFVCEARFAVFKRPCHCRNCGVCICSGCAVQWPSKMIPDTYNIKKESMINICKSCDWLCSAFRMAMLDGHYDRAVAIHATCNVNLVTPFANVKGELFYPVHCAVLGGSLELLQWLVDTHCCPLRSIRISGKTRQSSGSFTPILTSRGRSLLGIAMEKEKIDLVRYLVVDKGMPLTGEKDLNMGTLIRILDRLLRTMPSPGQAESSSQRSLGNGRLGTPPPRQFGSGIPDTSSTRQTEASWRADEALAFELAEQLRREEDSQGSVEDACIICFANSIDCVVTPCGHQICCMTCSKNISRCPVCGVDCSFIRVFRANANS